MNLRFASLAISLSVSAGLAATSGTGITFNKDIAPILQKNCQACHRPGEAAPMSLLSYKEVRPWAAAIKEAVALKKMPPWFADPHYGTWSNDRSLAKSDIAAIEHWVDSGAPEGDPKEAPAALKFVDGWNIGKPEMVLEMPAAYQVPATGTIDYQYIVIPGKFTEDRWVTMAEVRPGNRAVLHHVIAFVRNPGSKWLEGAQPGVPVVPKKGDNGIGEFLVGYAPGTVPVVFDGGRAKLIKAGSDIVFQLHYTSNGTAAADRTAIGITFAKEAPKERVFTIAASTTKFAIPPGDPNFRVDSKFEFARDAKVIAYIPHMHLRGKDFEFRVKYPDGRSETLLKVPNYSFNWQLSYLPAKELQLPAGAVIECTAHYDNSANNPNNPDATKEVHYGDQSWEEMMFGFFDVAIDPSLSVGDLVPKRKPGAPSAPAL